MKFQLVFQFEAHTIEDFDLLTALEGFLILELASDRRATVDGHDFGTGEFNVFIHTDEPRDLFTRVGDLIRERHPHLRFSAGFRAFEEDNYTVLWPSSRTQFSVA